MQFNAPNYRAASGDLTIAISPLGLVELADEEFEVHGPRLNRYATNWAFYLGHHWGYRREVGEAQLTFNYVRAFSDYITNFCFGKGIDWRVPAENEAIVPYLLKRVWETDNDREKLFWEIGQQGSVTGDCFVKVAYEPAWVDPVGMEHPGRVRIIPLNSAFCFPEFHPHDRSRLLRFKLKYRFWGTSLEGTRQVFTYTEILTDNFVEEYINDELIDQRPNPLGRIPVVHWPNVEVSSSPWGLPDIHDILTLNREYNEKATDISDIINYHAAPVTVITGAKASMLEKGPKKVWGGLPEKAKVYNLELGTNLGGPLEYMQLLKQAMHEMTGVPESALGQMQPISNTSGTALSIMYQPMMMRWHQKRIQYSQGLQRINELILLTLFMSEPETLAWNPQLTSGVEPKPDQLIVLDPTNPRTYLTEANWPQPLPLDVLVKLNEVQMKMALGLESKRGAFRDLGEEMPDQKAREIFDELKEDILEQGALDLLRMNIAMVTGTAQMVGEDGGPLVGQVTSAGGPDVTSAGGGAAPTPAPIPGMGPVEELLYQRISTDAYGTKIPQQRNPDNQR
jgi:hypothetical protein